LINKIDKDLLFLLFGQGYLGGSLHSHASTRPLAQPTAQRLAAAHTLRLCRFSKQYDFVYYHHFFLRKFFRLLTWAVKTNR
jgi:hypothetical protein